LQPHIPCVDEAPTFSVHRDAENSRLAHGAIGGGDHEAQKRLVGALLDEREEHDVDAVFFLAPDIAGFPVGELAALLTVERAALDGLDGVNE
jgi:hypothetical protein